MRVIISKDAPTLEEWLYGDNFNDAVDYDKKEWATDWMIENKIKACWFHVEADECGVFETDDTIFVAVSGSDKDKEEWRGNFDAYPPRDKKDVYPFYIDGFHYNYFVIAHKLFIKLADMYRNGFPKPVVFIGMSRGGLVDIVDDLVICSSKYSKQSSMVLSYDPPKNKTKKGKRWVDRNKKRNGIRHRCKTKFAWITVVLPRILGWRYYEDTLLKLPNVWGFNHTNIKKAIKKAIRKRDKSFSK